MWALADGCATSAAVLGAAGACETLIVAMGAPADGDDEARGAASPSRRSRAAPAPTRSGSAVRKPHACPLQRCARAAALPMSATRPPTPPLHAIVVNAIPPPRRRR